MRNDIILDQKARHPDRTLHMLRTSTSLEPRFFMKCRKYDWRFLRHWNMFSQVFGQKPPTRREEALGTIENYGGKIWAQLLVTRSRKGANTGARMFSAGDKLLLLNIGFHTSFLGWQTGWLLPVAFRLGSLFFSSFSFYRTGAAARCELRIEPVRSIMCGIAT